MKTGRTDCIRRAVDSGATPVLEEEGESHLGRCFEMHVLRARFYRTGSRRDAFPISDLDLPYSKSIFLYQSQQRPDAGAV
jgi:hypothetical protein